MNLSMGISLLLSFCLVAIFTPIIIKIAKDKNWLDKPDQRKVHKKPIPALGGLGIYFGFWIIVFSFGNLGESNEIYYLWGASWHLFVTSAWDDMYDSSPLFRLINQIIVGSICYLGGIEVTGFYGLMGIGEVAGIFQYFLTVITVVTMINAFNLIDGINGLAGSLFLQGAIIFSILFWQTGQNNCLQVTLVSIGAVSGFLLYNFRSARIFMGDNGSTFLGLLLYTFLIQFLNANPTTVAGGDNSQLIIGLSIICLPILDLIRVSLGRMMQRKSPFSPDKTHIHHLLLTRGKSHQYATIQIVCIQLVIFRLGFLLSSYYSSLAIIMILMVLYIGCIAILRWSMDMTEIKRMEVERLSIGGDYKLS